MARLTIPMPAAFREAPQTAADKVIAGFRPEHLELGDIPARVGDAPGHAPTSWSTSATRSCSTSRVDGREIVAIVDSSHTCQARRRPRARLPVDKLHLFDAATGASMVRMGEAAAA